MRGSHEEKEKEAIFAALTPWGHRPCAAGTMGAGQQWQPPDTATTVVSERGQVLLLDRPVTTYCCAGYRRHPAAE